MSVIDIRTVETDRKDGWSPCTFIEHLTEIQRRYQALPDDLDQANPADVEALVIAVEELLEHLDGQHEDDVAYAPASQEGS